MRILLFPSLTPFCLHPSSYFWFKFIFPFLPVSLLSIPHSYYFSSAQSLKTIFLSISHLTLFSLSYNIFIIIPLLLIFTQLWLILGFLWHFFKYIPSGSLFSSYFKSHILLFTCPTLLHLPPALSYFHFKYYFLPFLD